MTVTRAGRRRNGKLTGSRNPGRWLLFYVAICRKKFPAALCCAAMSIQRFNFTNGAVGTNGPPVFIFKKEWQPYQPSEILLVCIRLNQHATIGYFWWRRDKLLMRQSFYDEYIAVVWPRFSGMQHTKNVERRKRCREIAGLPSSHFAKHFLFGFSFYPQIGLIWSYKITVVSGASFGIVSLLSL